MAEYKFTAAINPATFPLVTRFQARTIIIAGLDNRLRAANSSTRDSSDNNNNPQNLPQVLYCENVMPFNEGVASVSFDAIQEQVSGADEFDEVFMLRNENEDIVRFSPAQGLNYTTPAFGTAWTSTDPLPGAPVGDEVSIAYVNGITFVCYANLALLQWDGTNLNDVSASLQGVVIADIKAICGSGNYLCLLCEDLSFKWSTLVDPLDFADSSAGAGSQIPVDIRGKPICLTSVSGGVIIHCAQNAVAAMATNNDQAPWVFREIKNAGGVSSRKAVSTDNTSGAVFIWGTNGFQRLGLRESEEMFPSLNDFLAGRVLEEFDGSTNTLTFQRLSSNLRVKVAYIAGRYIVVSYGADVEEYDYALIYDLELRRWGKIKQGHVDCFSNFEDPLQSICLLKANGVVYRVILDRREQTAAGVLILGRYQLNRTNQICSQELELELLDDEEQPSVTILSNFNGTTVGYQMSMMATGGEANYREYQGQIEGKNISFLLKGSFTLASFIITATKGAASRS